jgi:hypothetical protein
MVNDRLYGVEYEPPKIGQDVPPPDPDLPTDRVPR